MYLGINTHFIMKFNFEEGLQFAQDLGLKGMEVAAGGQTAKEYCDLDKLLADEGQRHRWLDAFARHDLEVVSLSCHGAPLMPEENIATEYRRQFRQACELMEKIGIRRMTLVAGLDPRYDDMRRAPYVGGFTTLYDMTPDGHPIVGPIQDVEGFWCDCGWSGNGFAPAPAGGRSLAQMILGRNPDIDLSYFQWPRRTDVVRRPAMDWVLR